MLHAILRGAWLLSDEWLLRSMEAGELASRNLRRYASTIELVWRAKTLVTEKCNGRGFYSPGCVLTVTRYALRLLGCC